MLPVAPSSLMVSLGTEDLPVSSLVQVMPPQTGLIVMVAMAPVAETLHRQCIVWWPTKPHMASATWCPRWVTPPPLASAVGAAGASSWGSARRREWGWDTDTDRGRSALCKVSWRGASRVRATLDRLPTSTQDAYQEALPFWPRSSRIVAQPLAHIPAFKQGEVLLNKRLGIALPTAPVLPPPTGILDALRSGTLSSSEVEGLATLFPVFNGRVCELFRKDP